ncbi:MAG: XylR family transcriptional regulator [Planctomycetia bacterium]|nr:XylR family transcriptional regulator [Planctomycetia bacterium]
MSEKVNAMPLKPRQRPLKVAVLFSPLYANLRQKAAGVARYSRLYGPWEFSVVPRGLQDPFLPDVSQWRPDGVIGQNLTPAIIDRIVDAKIPIIVFEPTYEQRREEHPFHGSPTVRIDSEAIGQLAAQYFLERHFSHFAYVCEYDNIYWSDVREEAFSRVLHDYGYPCDVYHGHNLHENMVDRDSDLERWLMQLPKPVAILACNDHQGRRVLNSCLRTDISVPYQASVLGVDNDEFFCMTANPMLSSIGTEAEWGGYQGAKMLDLLLRGETTAEKDILYGPTETVSRQSTAVTTLADPFVIKALEFIRINNGCQIRVSDVIHHVNVSQRTLENHFQTLLGTSIMDQIKKVRNETILRLVRETDTPVKEIALQVGFETSIHLCSVFRKEFGMTISTYRRDLCEREGLFPLDKQ